MQEKGPLGCTKFGTRFAAPPPWGCMKCIPLMIPYGALHEMGLLPHSPNDTPTCVQIPALSLSHCATWGGGASLLGNLCFSSVSGGVSQYMIRNQHLRKKYRNCNS